MLRFRQVFKEHFAQCRLRARLLHVQPTVNTVSRSPAERVAIAATPAADFPVEGVALETVERELLKKAMAKAGNNKSQAAKLLGLTRGQLYSLLRRHGLTDARR